MIPLLYFIFFILKVFILMRANQDQVHHVLEARRSEKSFAMS
jgi:hypothetical protein